MNKQLTLSTLTDELGQVATHKKEFLQGKYTGIEFHLRLFCAKEEPRRIQCVGIEEREDAVDAPFQVAVCHGGCYFIGLEKAVKLGPRYFPALGHHMVPAEMHRKGDVRKSLLDTLRRDPVLWVFGVVVVAVYRQTVAADEIVAITVAVAVFGADIVTVDCGLQTGLIQNHISMRRITRICI